MYQKIINKLNKYNKIAILGFGREGKSTYKFIRKYLKEIEITILDQNNIDNELFINDKNTTIKTGDNYLEHLEVYDIIIKTPGISLTNIDYKEYKDKIYSQLELLLEECRENIIGITGTKGKSTTSSLLYQVVKAQKENTFFVGNIGIPIFDEVEQFNQDSTIIVEMSSHQLEFVNTSPHIGVILNLYQDHLDHSGTLENYHNSKFNILRYQDKNDYAICSADNSYLNDMLDKNELSSTVLKVSLEKTSNIYLKDDIIYLNNKKLCNKEDIKTNLVGIHNLMNIMFVIMICNILKLDIKKAIEEVANFKPLEHRMEFVGKYKDILFYNDSIATIPEATINACKALKTVNTLIIGGQDRGIEYQKLIDYIKTSDIKNIICMKTTGHKLSDKIKTNNNIVIKVDSLEDAVIKAYELTEKNKICIMSPSAPSYEFYKNFEEKGKAYKELVIENSK